MLKKIFIKLHINKSKNLTAFTLVETMVATGIILVAILGPISVAVTASSYARDTKDNITATYLAQEAIELLRYKRDTLFLNCITGASCIPQPILILGNAIESPKESAWRIFKEQLGFPASNCFNVARCTYDVLSFTLSPQSTPSLYSKGDTNCDLLYRNDTGDGTGNTDFMYLCTKNKGVSWYQTYFTRDIKLTDIQNVTDGYSENYEDDIKVEVTVGYRKNNGLLKNIKIVDFIHSKS